MPRQLVTLIYCDVCEGDVEEDNPTPLSLRRKTAEPDLCPACKKKLEDFLEPYLKKRPSPTKKTVVDRGGPTAGDDEKTVGPCGVDGCQTMAKSEGGMNLHKNRTHGISAAA